MKIALLTMPFLSVNLCSLGLTQLKGRIKEVFKDQIDIHLYYINHDFYRYLGPELYKKISNDSQRTGIVEWVFRLEAFDHVKDNQDEYFAVFYRDPATQQFFARYRNKLRYMGRFIDEMIIKYKLTSFDVVGINSTFSVVPGLSFSRHLKRFNKQIVTVMGGASVYKEMGEVLVFYYPYLDYVCSGSGLISFPQLIGALLEKDHEAGNSIAGMFSKINIGKVKPLSEELDINHPIDLDYSDYLESFKQLKLNDSVKPNILLETSRGCYWRKCTFCSLNEDQIKFRVKHTDKAIEEINSYIKRYNCDLEMVDNVLPRHYIQKVLPYLHVPGNIRIVYETRADYTDTEMKILKQAGVTQIQPGIESLSTDVLELMKKGVNAFQCIRMLKLCIKYLILHAWNLLVGFPGMTADMYEELISTVKNVTHLCPPLVLNSVEFHRYSTYWMEKEKYQHLELSPFSTYEYIYPYDKKFISDFAYYFEDVNYSSERMQLVLRYFPVLKTLVDQWKKRWDVQFLKDLPKLYCYHKEGSPCIYDSRQEQVREYQISHLEERILTHLHEPCCENSIKDHFPGENPESITQALTQLIDKRLVFKEREQLMSLVIDDYPDEFFSPSM